MQIYKGIPELIEYTIWLVVQKSEHNSLAIVAYHYLWDIVHAADHALNHYLTLTLNEHYLQNSHLGTPYQKWAKVSNDNFRDVDRCLKSIFPVIKKIYSDKPRIISPGYIGDEKSAYVWMYGVTKKYSSCHINSEQPVLTLSTISFDGWLDAQKRFLGSYLVGISLSPVTKKKISVADRSVLSELKREGLTRVEIMKSHMAGFAYWLEANYTVPEVITHPMQKHSEAVAELRQLRQNMEGDNND